MIGAIIGDIVGSRFEFNNHRSEDFELFMSECFFTDDTVMTLAVAKAIMDWRDDGEYPLERFVVRWLRLLGQKYPKAGYGGAFKRWLTCDDPEPYNSFGNGAAMRISPVGEYAMSERAAVEMSKAVTWVTHDHPEGIKGAEAVTRLIYAARRGTSMYDLRAIAEGYYNLNFTIDEIRPTYRFNETCQGTVPQAIEAFLESTSFEDAIRIAVSVGGDTDTLAAITGGIAEAYYGVPAELEKQALLYLPLDLLAIYEEWKRIMKLKPAPGN